jgi:hypothetical protein
MELNAIISNYSDFLYFFKKSFPNSIFHNSNIFHRDIQYVLTRYIQKKEKNTLPVLKSEDMAFQIESELEKKGIFKKVSDKTWVLNYPDFIKPKVEKTN